MGKSVTLDEFFNGYCASRLLFAALLDLVREVGPAEVRATRSQIAFRRKKAFAWVWIPEKHLRRKAAPLVLSLAFPARDPSPRWKEIVEPARGRFMHHLELYSIGEIDAEVKTWWQAAWELAGE